MSAVGPTEVVTSGASSLRQTEQKNFTNAKQSCSRKGFFFFNQPQNPWGHMLGLHLARHEPLLVAAQHIGNLLLVHNPHCLLNADLRICSVPCRSALSTCLLLEPLEGHVKPNVRHKLSQCFLQWLLQVQQRQSPPVVDYTACPTSRSNNGLYILLCQSLTSLVRRG